MGSRFPDTWLARALLLFLTAASLGLAQTVNKKEELDRSLAAFAKVYENERHRQLSGYPELEALFAEYLGLNIAIDCGNAPATWHLAGSFYQRNGQWDHAVRCFTRALELGFEPWQAYAGRSYCYARQGDFANAIADAGKVIELEREVESPFAYESRAAIYVEMGDYNKAISDYSEAIKAQKIRIKKAYRTDPYDYKALYDLYTKRGVAHVKNGAYDKGIADVLAPEKDLLPGPGRAKLYRFVAEIYQLKGDAKNADKYLRKAQAMEPEVKK